MIEGRKGYRYELQHFFRMHHPSRRSTVGAVFHPQSKSICVFCLLFSQIMGMANYERLSRIGKGTFGVVYQARHKNSGKILGEYRV